jgi:gas vesicle protein
MNTGKVVLGVIGGAAAGALIGVLFAPDRGSETRKKILDAGKDYLGDWQGKIEGFRQSANNKYDNFVSESKDAVAREAKGIIAKEMK